MSPSEPCAYVYIVRCADGSFYTGITRRSVEQRLNEHNSGLVEGYTSSRRPVELVWSQEFQWATDAIAAERRIKGWSRKKKIALINGDWEGLRSAAKKSFGNRNAENA